MQPNNSNSLFQIRVANRLNQGEKLIESEDDSDRVEGFEDALLQIEANGELTKAEKEHLLTLYQRNDPRIVGIWDAYCRYFYTFFKANIYQRLYLANNQIKITSVNFINFCNFLSVLNAESVKLEF